MRMARKPGEHIRIVYLEPILMHPTPLRMPDILLGKASTDLCFYFTLSINISIHKYHLELFLKITTHHIIKFKNSNLFEQMDYVRLLLLTLTMDSKIY